MTKDWIPPTREAILAALRDANMPMPPDQLAQLLDVSEQPHREILGRRLAAMERDGQLMPNRKGVLLLASKLDFIAGSVIGHRDGFGFMRPDDGGPDLFLSSRQMQKVMHGDRVLVKESGKDGRGRPEAAIVEVTERANRQLVGRFLNERGVFMVVPEDKRIKHDILIAPGFTNGAAHGQVVSCEITDPPNRNVEPIGRVLDILGEIDDPGMEVQIAVRKFDVPHEFDPACLKQASALPNNLVDADVKGRVDLRDVPLLTIDGADARDFDDAVYCEPIYSSGQRPRLTGYRLLVAIADVSHYVRPGEALDDDAIERSTSVYFPREVIPMLPEKLSNGLCSLNPMVDRLVMVCDMVVGLKGNVRAYQFYEAVMHSAARMTYDRVWQILSADASTPSPATDTVNLMSIEGGELEERLQWLYQLFGAFSKARNVRGALEFDTVETRIECDADGRITQIVPSVRNDAHRLIEECMLAANVCAADFVKRSKHAALFRVHEGPNPEKLKQLRAFLRTCNLSLAGGDDPSPADYAALGNKIQGRPDTNLLQTMMLRSMQQAVYSPENGGHFGLAFDAYAHFTSPIRRYPDLLLHRVIKAVLSDKKYVPVNVQSQAASLVDSRKRPVQDKSSGKGNNRKASDSANIALWAALGKLCSSNERRADDASRDVTAWLKCEFMRERVGEEYKGRITGVAPFGVFVTLIDLHVEGMVHVSELGSDYFQYNETGHEMVGERTGKRYRLTDDIHVQVSRVDMESRRIEFKLGQDNAGDSRPAANGKSRDKRGAGADRHPSEGSSKRKSKSSATPTSERAKSSSASDKSGPDGKRKSDSKSRRVSRKKPSRPSLSRKGRRRSS